MVKAITDLNEFNQLLKSSGKVVVDFTATWCGPCKVIAPVFEELAGQHNEVTFIKVDVDSGSDIATQAKINAMPTFVAYKNGTEVSRFSGASKEQLAQLVTQLKSA